MVIVVCVVRIRNSRIRIEVPEVPFMKLLIIIAVKIEATKNAIVGRLKNFDLVTEN